MQTTILPAAAAMALGVGFACAFEARERARATLAGGDRQSERAGDRYPDAHQPCGGPALSAERGLHLLRGLQHMTRVAEQGLAVVGKAEPTRRAVE